MKEAVQRWYRPKAGQQREREGEREKKKKKGKKKQPHREMSLLPEIRTETHPAKNKEGGKEERGRKRQM